MEISPKMQHQLAQFEQLRQQIQVIANQRINLEAKLKELENALEELDKIDEDTTVYRSVGSLLVKSPGKGNIIEKLKEDKETTEIRVKTVQRQEEQLKSKYDELQGKLTEALKKIQSPDLA
jgi:prefoldin beta subunit